MRLLQGFVVGLIGFSASVMALSEPRDLLGSARGRALDLLPEAKLYSVASTAKGWDYVYYSKVPRTRDHSEIAKVIVRFTKEEGKAPWAVDTIVSHGEKPTWGTLPLDDSFRPDTWTLAQIERAAADYFKGHEFTIEWVSLSRPDIESAPAVNYLVFGKVCNQNTHVVFNGSTGEVFDAPERPSCPI